MDFFSHYRNTDIHPSSSSLVITNNKNFHGREVEKKRNKRNNKISNKVIKLSTDPQSVAARERRHRISEKFKTLKSLIPGSDSRNMDTVSMLEEAIQYIKYLKSQIWVHQTMISFDNNFDDYDHQFIGSRNCCHQDDHVYGDHDYHHLSSLPNMEHEISPHQLGFSSGSCLKVEEEDINMVSISHDYHHVITQ